MSGLPAVSGYTIKLRTGTLATLGNVYPGEIVCVVDQSNKPIGLQVNANSNQFLSASNAPSILNRDITGYAGIQGSQGDTGSRGSVGLTGYSGVQGFAGMAGDTGATGASSSTGFTGYYGPQGSTGPTGAQGAGLTGSPGSQGSQGRTGATGVVGWLGSKGAQGATGDTGLQGVTGYSGNQGQTGFRGAIGYTGSQGGATGATGAQGATGWTGTRGFTGTSGVQGDTGFNQAGGTGIQGLTGITGTQGYTGSAGYNGVTGAAGTQGFTGASADTGINGALGATGGKGSQGSTGVQGYTGSKSGRGTTGATGTRGSTGSPGDTGAQGDTGISNRGSTGPLGRMGYTGAQGSTGPANNQGATGILGPQGYTGSRGATGSQGIDGDTGTQGTAAASGLIPLTGITGPAYIVGYTGINGSPYLMFNSGAVYQSNILTVGIVNASNLTTSLIVQPPYTSTPITYLTSSNSGSNTLFIIKNTSNSYPVSVTSQNLYATFSNLLFTQMILHPAGWAYLYSDSNVNYATACNYIYSFNMSTSNLSNLGFSTAINHMGLDPLGNVFASFSNKIVKYTVNTSTGALTSNYSWIVPSGSKLYVTAGYVYAYLTATTSNVLRFNNFSNTACNIYTSAIFSNDASLSYLSSDPNDQNIYCTTLTGNVYSYSLATSTVKLIASNLDYATNIPYVDTYTATLYSSLTTLGNIQRIPLDGTQSSNLVTLYPPVNPSYNANIAGFASPTALVYNPVDSNIYVCSSFLIRRITPLGVITTIAGRIPGSNNGVGSLATFSVAYRVCVDTTGSNLYIADLGNNSIRKLVIATSNVSTFATGLSGPQGVVCDTSNLYVADTGNHVIKSYSLTTSNMSFLVGSNGVSGSINGVGSAARFFYPKGLAITSNFSILYIADSSNFTVRALPMASLNTTIYMGQPGSNGFTSSNLAGPSAVTLDSNGLLYVVDTGNNAILYAKSVGILSSSNNLITGVSSIYSLTMNPSSPNIIYACDQNSYKVFSYNLSTSTATNIYTLSSYAQSITVDSNSNTYVSVRTQGIFRNGSLITGTNTIGINVSPLCVDPAGTYVYAVTSHQIYKVTIPSGPAVLLAGSPVNGNGYVDGIGSNARFYQIGGICIDNAASNLYVCDTYNYVIRKINLQTSNVTTIVGLYNTPWSSTPIDGIGSSARCYYLCGITQSTSGLLYFVDELYTNFAAWLRTIDPVTLTVKTLCSIPGGLSYANFVTNFTETAIYLPSTGNGFSQNSLGFYTAVLAGSNLGFNNGTGLSAQFNTPLGISFQGSNIIVADKGNYLLRLISPNSNVITYAGSNIITRNVDGVTQTYINLFNSLFSSIGALCTDLSGNVYVADGQYIRFVTPGGFVTTIASNFSTAKGITFDPLYTYLYVSDTGNNTIKRIALSNYSVTVIAGSTQGYYDTSSSVTSVYTPPVPPTIPGLQLWLDASDPFGNGTVPANGATLTSWIDKSSNAYNTTNLNVNNSTPYNVMYYQTSYKNGIGGISLPGWTSPYASIPAGTFANSMTIFAVFNCTGSTNLNAPLLYRTGNAPANNRPHPFGIEYANFEYDYGADPTNNTGNILAFNPFQVTSPILINAVYRQTGAPSLYLYSNGNILGSNIAISPAPSGQDIGTRFFVAGRGDGNGNRNDSVFGEVLVYNTTPTTLQRQQIEGYLAYKWGFTLPVSHPYYGRSSAISTYTISPILAQFNAPGQICIDRTNTNIYVADSGNNVIRLINLSTAVTSTFIGTAQAGAYQEGTGASAYFNQPTGISIDSIGSKLYVADSGNNLIRQIVIATKTSTLFAGSTGGFADGIAGAAQFRFPVCIIIDSAGSNLYISDYTNNRIRRIVLSNATVSTLAGSATAGSSNGIGTAASFTGPFGIAVYSNILYTGEVNNPQVRLITLTTSNVTTFVGSNIAGYLDTPYVSYASYNTPQSLSVYSNALYTMMSLYSNSIMVQIPFTSYPSTTFTFSNTLTPQIQNTTGRQVTIAVTGSTVTNPIIQSLPNISDVLTLYNTGVSYTLI